MLKEAHQNPASKEKERRRGRSSREPMFCKRHRAAAELKMSHFSLLSRGEDLHKERFGRLTAEQSV